MKPVRKMPGKIAPGDVLHLAGQDYMVRTAKSDRNKLRHLTAANTATGVIAKIRLDPQQDFWVTEPEVAADDW